MRLGFLARRTAVARLVCPWPLPRPALHVRGLAAAQRDLVADVAQRMVKRRERLLSAPTDGDASQQIKLLEPLFRAYTAWNEARELYKTTAHMAENDPDKDMRELAALELEAHQEAADSLRDEVKKQILQTQSPIVTTGAIIEIKQGVGGQESTIFAGEMLRMYTKYCESRMLQAQDAGDMTAMGATWRTELLSQSLVDVSSSGNISEGIREAILQVHGHDAYDALRFEAGVHRVQRIPTTQNLGKLQTSTIAILVMPVQAETTTADDIVDPADVKIETMRSRGAGGQHVNRTESAVRLTHTPTGISVSMQESRSQHQNRARAWEVLRARLLDRKMRADAESNRALRRSQVASADRSERVRTYNFPQDRVTDHRVGISLSGITQIMDGDDGGGAGLTYLIQELQEREAERQLEGLLEEYADE
ncbi:Peptide chain release factor 1, mitochondrial [Malassezia cuniculi]|uniref:Peptide chain release factor 1, mitochondrial n=1 Tax=Malassezia cuniculi TaxID=948313 RepID=A0AAF0ER76_9BASI|nr:Peptide chain release factor 1, mitochondrial [Malassezia cuniculi]